MIAAVMVMIMVVVVVMMIVAAVIVVVVVIVVIIVMVMVVAVMMVIVVMAVVIVVMAVVVMMVIMIVVMAVVIVVMVVVVIVARVVMMIMIVSVARVVVMMIVVVGMGVAVDMRQFAVGVAVGMPVPALLFLAVYGNLHPHASDPAAFRGEPPRAHPGDAQGVQLRGEPLWVRQKTGQRGHQHVPRGAHAALKIQRFHLIPSMRLIMLAKYPAPKPLSIFTTLTPLAQEFSMDSSAESPPKLAP